MLFGIVGVRSVRIVLEGLENVTIADLPGITDTDKRLNTMRVTSSLLLMVGVYTFETEVWQCIDWGNIEVKRDFRRTGMTTGLLR